MSNNWKYNLAQATGCLTWVALAALIIVASLMKGCAGWRMESIHLDYMGVGVDLGFNHVEEATFHMQIPMEPRAAPIYQEIGNLKVHLNMKDSSQVYRLIPSHYVVMADTVHKTLYIAYDYQRIK